MTTVDLLRLSRNTGHCGHVRIFNDADGLYHALISYRVHDSEDYGHSHRLEGISYREITQSVLAWAENTFGQPCLLDSLLHTPRSDSFKSA